MALMGKKTISAWLTAAATIKAGIADGMRANEAE
jgi:hypothetical protein